jgi:hypothetical protein
VRAALAIRELNLINYINRTSPDKTTDRATLRFPLIYAHPALLLRSYTAQSFLRLTTRIVAS